MYGGAGCGEVFGGEGNTLKIESGKSKIESERQIHLPQRNEYTKIRRGFAMMGTPLWKKGAGVS